MAFVACTRTSSATGSCDYSGDVTTTGTGKCYDQVATCADLAVPTGVTMGKAFCEAATPSTAELLRMQGGVLPLLWDKKAEDCGESFVLVSFGCRELGVRTESGKQNPRLSSRNSSVV